MGKHEQTIPIAMRLPESVYSVVVRRAGKMGIKPSEWLKNRIVYDVRRVHGIKRSSPQSQLKREG
jgi:hypothetical protein